jgi:hypothetical protein
MSTRFLLIAAFLIGLFSAPVSAQTTYRVGLTAGPNYSTLKSDLFTTSSGRPGLAAGFSIIMGLGDRFEFNQEVAFVQKGAEARAVMFQPEDVVEEKGYKYYYNSFEAAFLAGYEPFATVPVRVQAGAVAGTHTHSLDRSQRELMVGDYESINDATRAVDLNDAFSGVDFGPVFGVSAGDGAFRANLRYYLGVKNLYNNLDFVEGGHSIRSSAVRLSLTYFW